MVKIQEAENQIITSYAVYEKRPSDSALLIPAIEAHEEQLARVRAGRGRRGLLLRQQ